MIDDKQLASWRALCDAATSGPWSQLPRRHVWAGRQSICEIDQNNPAESTDAAFIVAARTAMPALIDEAERLRRVLDEAARVERERIVAWINKLKHKLLNEPMPTQVYKQGWFDALNIAAIEIRMALGDKEDKGRQDAKNTWTKELVVLEAARDYAHKSISACENSRGVDVLLSAARQLVPKGEQ
jgi:hypothetical protein